ncbi:15-hydroxyprostaglandin dehydrogenase [NAD(+)]-like isoform X1 [Battus philenor]|uniref:15-hydroxyprostaglandin dehydrogenase [NAD(+)]-like isoform X1 n=1 Tax=Battus philenor TaxID=42288 RepID=UPI0035D01320
MIDVNDKVVFLTGGAKGIGAAVVKEFLQRGAKHVAFLDIDKNGGLKFENELAECYGKNKVKFIECDVGDDEQLFGAYNSVIADNGYIDVVINNAGVGEQNNDNYKNIININIRALITSTIKGLEHMRVDRGGKGGTIINVSSTAALCQLSPSYFVYFATKSAVQQFSNCIGMQNYYSRTGVRVVTVCLGSTDTEILGLMKSFDPEAEDEIRRIVSIYPVQSLESAARGLLTAFELGESGDTWLVNNDKPARNITEKIKKAYEIMSEDLLN